MDKKAIVEAAQQMSDFEFTRFFYELAQSRRDWEYGSKVPRRFVLGFVRRRTDRAFLEILALPDEARKTPDWVTSDDPHQQGGCQVCGVNILTWTRSTNCPICGNAVNCS